MSDPYAVLHIPRDAKPPVIRAAYRTLAKKTHPDVCVEPKGLARFLAICDAYAILNDPRRRAEYDALVAEQEAKVPAASPPKPSPSRTVAVARAGIAIVQLAYLGGLALLALIVTITVLVEVVSGK